MPGFSSIADYVDAHEAGRVHTAHFRKVPSQLGIAGWWHDISMAAGTPVPQYYAATPLAAATLDGFRGVFHGDAKSPATKFLSEIRLLTPSSTFQGQFMLMDYLLYYPFVDCDSTEVQAVDNTVTLPRYADGEGVQVMAVVVAPTVGSGVFTFDYVNQSGVSRTSPAQGCSTTSAPIAALLTSQQSIANANGPFLKLASGDTGVRSITSVTFSVLNGGLAAFVLVKPLANAVIRELNTESEMSYINMRPGPPRIYDGAYLNFIFNAPGTIATAILMGSAQFVWST